MSMQSMALSTGPSLRLWKRSRETVWADVSKSSSASPPTSPSVDAAVVTVVAPSELFTSWLEVGVSEVFSEEMCEIMSSTEERETQSCIHSLTW